MTTASDAAFGIDDASSGGNDGFRGTNELTLGGASGFLQASIGDPLGLYLRSLKTLKDRLPEDVFVLPGHQLPFHGLHRRCDELVEHHTARCAAITEASAAKPCSVAELVPVLFPKVLDPHQLGFAFSETQAHVNRMVYAGELAWSEPLDGIWRVAAAS